MPEHRLDPGGRFPPQNPGASGFLQFSLHGDRHDYDTVRLLLAQSVAEPVLQAFGDSVLHRAIQGPGAELLSVYGGEEKGGRKAIADRMSKIWRLDMRSRPRRLARVLHYLRQHPGVARAHLEGQFRPSMASRRRHRSGNPALGQQTVLSSVQDGGLGVAQAWGYDSGKGDGVLLGVVEQGWVENHEDLSGRVELVYGTNVLNDGLGARIQPDTTVLNQVKRVVRARHGTNSIGVVAAKDNAAGGVGMCPGIDGVLLASYWDKDTGVAHDVAGAILALVERLGPDARPYGGDVILIEVEASAPDSNMPDVFLPVEVDPVVRSAIELATASGIVVVQAAGNSGVNLDSYVGAEDGAILNRWSEAHLDTGAIMVGASQWVDGELARIPESNHGSRVDCCAEGMGVFSTGFGANDPVGSTGAEGQGYTKEFSYTSAASAQVAGAAVLLQGQQRQLNAKPGRPAWVRAQLASPGTGRVSGEEWVGVRPDLERLLRLNRERLLAGAVL